MEFELSIRQLFIGYFLVYHFLYAVNPAIAYAIAELFFLSPCNAFGQHVFKCFTQNVFFYFTIPWHFIVGV